MAKKNMLHIAAAALIFCFLCTASSFADTVTATADMVAGVTNVFSIEFYTSEPAKVLYSTSVPFTSMDPTKTFCYADGRSDSDGKSDVGILCRTNLGQVWYLKVNASTSSPDFNLANFKYYLGQPWNRTRNATADGTLSQASAWNSIPTSLTTLYTAGQFDKNNLAYGTLATFSFAINPAGMTAGRTYNITITYTMTTAQ
ncbi:MAG: hypothetical protein WCT15_02625 [Candidatus Omnitrophota bacterium]